MENTIDFYFNPLFKEGTEFVLQNVRNVYPPDESKIFVWVDADYLIKDTIVDITNKYNSTPMISTDKFTWCSRLNPEESKHRLLEWFRRLQKTAEISIAKWIMYLEDDVLVRSRVVHFPKTQAAINAGNVASGGSIYDRETIVSIFSKYSDDGLLNFMQTPPYHFAADRTLLKIFDDNNVSVSKFLDLADGIPPDKTDKPILHDIKTHYPSYYKEYRLYLDGQLSHNPMLTDDK